MGSNSSTDIATTLENSERTAENTLTTETKIFSAAIAKWIRMAFASTRTLSQNSSTASLSNVLSITASSLETFTLKLAGLKLRKKVRKKPLNYQTGMMSTTTMSFTVTISCGTNQAVKMASPQICVLLTTRCMMELS